MLHTPDNSILLCNKQGNHSKKECCQFHGCCAFWATVRIWATPKTPKPGFADHQPRYLAFRTRRDGSYKPPGITLCTMVFSYSTSLTCWGSLVRVQYRPPISIGYRLFIPNPSTYGGRDGGLQKDNSERKIEIGRNNSYIVDC